MLDFFFGWRKASKCKKLIRITQCRLKLLISKKVAVIRILKEGIAQLLKNGHEQIASNKLDKLYLEENVMSTYEMLNTFSEFILLNLSYIRKTKDIPNDINEAISTLIFTPARIGDLPELRAIRKVFSERYGQRFVTAAIELYPGNLVNCQVKDKLMSQSVPDDVKNRIVNEIVRDYFFKPGLLAIEYKPNVHEQLEKVIECTKDQSHGTEEKEISMSNNYSIVLQSFASTLNSPKHSKITSIVPLSPPYQYSTFYLDDIEEFMSPNKKTPHSDVADQDQRFFLFKMETPNPDKNVINEKLAKKRMRSRSTLPQKNRSTIDAQLELSYCKSPGNKQKCQKKIHFDEINSNNNQLSLAPVDNKVNGFCDSRNLASVKHVHPKLPDYVEIATKFRALKQAYQPSKSPS